MIWHSLSETDWGNRHTTFKAWCPFLLSKAEDEKHSEGWRTVEAYRDMFGRWCVTLRDPLPDERLACTS